jgi:hypothetical protein
MTEQEINETIATHIFDYEDYDMLVTSRHHNKRELFGAKKKDDNWTLVPNYCGDLNEMREAERLLDDDQWLEYMLNLQDVLQRDPHRGKWIVCQDNMHSTAAQRAKAFVITIGKYKE